MKVEKLMPVLSLAGAALLMTASQPASAVRMRVHVYPPSQVMTSSTVRAGHAVSASTDFNRLMAGGTYSVRCAHPDMPLDVPGQRYVSNSALLGGLQLNVTIPYAQPSYVNMPAFNALPRGTIVECQYAWTAQAVEGSLTIGGGGGSTVIGQGEARDGGVENFRMQQPGTANGEDDACIP